MAIVVQENQFQHRVWRHAGTVWAHYMSWRKVETRRN